MKNSIIITPESFKESYFRDDTSYFRSLESFLDKHNREFVVDDIEKTVTVEVVDELDAQRLAIMAKLKNVTYLEDGISKELVVAPPKKQGRPKNIIFIDGGSKGFTARQFNKYTSDELKKTHLTKTQVLKLGIVTKTKLDRYIADGTLKPIEQGNKIFISRKDLAELVGR